MVLRARSFARGHTYHFCVVFGKGVLSENRIYCYYNLGLFFQSPSFGYDGDGIQDD